MTAPLRLPKPIKTIARVVRDAPLSNLLISSMIRSLPDSHIRRRLAKRVTRLGKVSANLPDGSKIWMESDLAESVTTSVFYEGWMGEEPEVLPIWRELVAEADTILDIGAHVGHFSIIAGKTNPLINIQCFEPLPRVAHLLRRNLELNNIKAEIHQIALSNSVGDAAFYTVPYGVPSSSGLSREFINEIHGPDFDEIPVEAKTLDLLFPDMTGSVLMKIDTETTEPDVIEGARKLIGRVKPIIVVEVLPDHDTGPALHRELECAGYAFTPYLMTKRGLVRKPQVRADARWRNFLLVPDDGPFATSAIRSLLDARMAL